MCGIIGALSNKPVADRIVEGLKRLEYRGYDSAGIAILKNGELTRRRAVGKLSALTRVLEEDPIDGLLGIGHTRWATHGGVTVENAHPHATLKVSLVHNGIIENFAELRAELTTAGVNFQSDTDTEVIAQMLTYYLDAEGLTPKDAFAKTLSRLTGAYALAVILADDDNLMMAARRGNPLAIGHGDNTDKGAREMFIGSDAYALAPFTNRITYLEEGDWALIRRDGAEIFTADGAPAERPQTLSSVSANIVGKDGHRHFMAKEIYEQPEVISHTISHYADLSTMRMKPMEDSFDFSKLDRLTLSACGTAYYAALIARYWFERFARLPVEIDVASELRYRDVPYTDNGGAIFVSQSGETADTLAALRNAREQGQRIGAIVNVLESSIAREADAVFPILAGPEIGVASTKAFTCQLATLACLAIAAGRQRGALSTDEECEIVAALAATPRLVGEALKAAPEIERTAEELAKARDVLYIGRGVSFPLAMEGALKLKEISYIHAEGYAAGELKHGPIALIDEHTPIVVVAPSDAHFDKTISNMHEVIARKGKALIIADAQGLEKAGDGVWARLEAPTGAAHFAPIYYSAPIQLLAYFTATSKGTDVDQPRNLAKSVTVE